MINKVIFVSLVFLILISSCNDDDIVFDCIMPSPKNCIIEAGEIVVNFDTSIITPCPSTVNYVPINRYDYGESLFNPNDNNEIIYERVDNENFLKNEIWKYSFCTQETMFITDLAFYGLDWSIKDWIIFTGYDQQLYKIKSNGDSITQLTNNSNFNSHAKWNDEGTKYLYRKSTNPISGLRIATENGDIIDTLESLISLWTWSWKDNIIFYSEGSSIIVYGKYNIETKEKQEIGSFPLINASQIIEDITALENNAIIRQNRDEVVITDLNTLENTQILVGADNRGYGRFDLSPNSQTLVFKRVNQWKIDNCTIESESLLYLVDINGENERKIIVPE